MRAVFSILIAGGGLLLFMLGLCQPWFALPAGFESNGTLVLRDAPATLWWKCGCLAVTAVTLAWIVFRKRSGGLHGRLTAIFASSMNIATKRGRSTYSGRMRLITSVRVSRPRRLGPAGSV